jgi:hypothetical protein
MVPRTAGYAYDAGGLGFVHRSRAILCRAVPNPNVRFAFFVFIQVAGSRRGAWSLDGVLELGQPVGCLAWQETGTGEALLAVPTPICPTMDTRGV